MTDKIKDEIPENRREMHERWKRDFGITPEVSTDESEQIDEMEKAIATENKNRPVFEDVVADFPEIEDNKNDK